MYRLASRWPDTTVRWKEEGSGRLFVCRRFPRRRRSPISPPSVASSLPSPINQPNQIKSYRRRSRLLQRPGLPVERRWWCRSSGRPEVPVLQAGREGQVLRDAVEAASRRCSRGGRRRDYRVSICFLFAGGESSCVFCLLGECSVRVFRRYHEVGVIKTKRAEVGAIGKKKMPLYRQDACRIIGNFVS